MRLRFLFAISVCICVPIMSGELLPVMAGPSEPAVSGSLMLDGKEVALQYAYVDLAQPDEPIVVMPDKVLPADAVPFVSDKLVNDQKIHVLAFSLSLKDKKLTNTYGMLKYPGGEPGVGLGRVEEGGTVLTIQKLDDKTLEGKIATAKPVELSYVSYSFDLSFRVSLVKKSQ